MQTKRKITKECVKDSSETGYRHAQSRFKQRDIYSNYLQVMKLQPSRNLTQHLNHTDA